MPGTDYKLLASLASFFLAYKYRAQVQHAHAWFLITNEKRKEGRCGQTGQVPKLAVKQRMLRPFSHIE